MNLVGGGQGVCKLRDINLSLLVGYIGYAPELYKLLSHTEIKDSDDDQLYFTNLFLDEDLRTQVNMKLDSKSSIFHNLNGAASEVEL